MKLGTLLPLAKTGVQVNEGFGLLEVAAPKPAHSQINKSVKSEEVIPKSRLP